MEEIKGAENQVKLMILWSGAVVPTYQPFFYELAKFMRVRVLAPKKWIHGSVSFENYSRNEGEFSPPGEIVSPRYFPAKSSRYWVPALVLHLWLYRPHVLYIMDEMDRISLLWHALSAKLFWPKIRIISYSLQNLKSPAYHRWYHRLALKLNPYLVSQVIAASPQAHEVLLHHGFKGPCEIIPLWASEKFFYPIAENSRSDLRKRFGLHEKDIALLFSGGLVEAKGLILLQQALANFPNIKLIAAGLGNLESTLRKKLGHRFIYLGGIAGEELRQFYQVGEYIILPSLTMDHWQEQIGRSLIEGILCGCIAIGSDSGYIPKLTLFPETTFKQGDLPSLTLLLKQLPLLDPARIREAQRLNVGKHYTDKAVAEKTASFIKGSV